MLERLQKFENFISYSPSFFKWGLAVILLAVPLYPKFPIFNIPGTYVAVRAEDFIIAALFAFYLLYILRNFKIFFDDKINQAIFLFIIAGFISLASGVLLTQTVAPHIGFLHWARRIEYIIPFFIAASFARTQNTRFIVHTIFVTAFLAFVYGFGQINWGFPIISTQNDEFSKGLALRWAAGTRLHSTFAGHYDLSAFLILFFPFAIVWLFLVKKLIWRLFLGFVVIAPTFWLLMKAESRVSFIAFMIGIPVALWVIRRRIFIVPFLIISAVGMLTVGSLWEKYQNTVNIYKDKVIDQIMFVPSPVFAQDVPVAAPRRIRASTPQPEEIKVIEDRSTSIRFNVEWPRAIRAFEKNPLLGTGYSSITLATDSDYLRMLGEVGIIGTFAFLLILFRIIKTLSIYLKNNVNLDANTAYVGGFIGSFVGFLINATFIDVFEASKVAIIFWALAGIAISIAGKGVRIEKV